MKHNEQYIRTKLEEMKESFIDSNENASFTYDLVITRLRKNLTIKCEAHENNYKFSIDLDDMKGKLYLNDEFLYEEEFASIESALDHIEETIGVCEKKVHISFDKFVGDKINEAGGYDDKIQFKRHTSAYLDKMQKYYDNVIISLCELSDISEDILDDKLHKEFIKFMEDIKDPLARFSKEFVKSRERIKAQSKKQK